MNSFQGVIEGEAAAATPISGGVVPRAEANYGQFVVSVDLSSPEELTATISASTMAAPTDATVMPTAEASAASATVAGGQ